jgi:histidinol-phosphate/aromatic aminotransferase/cobyric acid decarboxylase-like protein
MNDLIPTKTVYCYYFPEVRKVITKVTKNYPHEIFLKSINPGLDDYHEAVIEMYCEHVRNQIIGLNTFEYRYTTAGASEGIFHILSKIASSDKKEPLYIFEGEYEGYSGYGTNLGLEFQIVDIKTNFSELEKGIFFISNPSARNGNILPNELFERIGKAGHEIIADLTYVGLTEPHEFKVDYPFIKAVIVSLSKPFGLYYYRVGFCFSREEINTLYVNKWFKNILSLKIAKEVLTKFSASELHTFYKEQQVAIIERLSKSFGIKVYPSDSLLLAYAKESEVPESLKESLQIYKRGGFYRFCLTPYFLEEERKKDEKYKVL